VAWSLAEEERGEPARTLSDHAAERNFQVRRVERFHAAEFQDVFGGLRFHDVDDVVEGDPAEQLAIGVHHGHGGDVVARHETRDILLILLRLYLHDRLLHHVPHEPRRGGDDETRDGHDAAQDPSRVNRVPVKRLSYAHCAARFRGFSATVASSRTLTTSVDMRPPAESSGVIWASMGRRPVGSPRARPGGRRPTARRQVRRVVRHFHELGCVVGPTVMSRSSDAGRLHFPKHAGCQLGRELGNDPDSGCLVQG
jgi:hypothetical protein